MISILLQHWPVFYQLFTLQNTQNILLMRTNQDLFDRYYNVVNMEG